MLCFLCAKDFPHLLEHLQGSNMQCKSVKMSGDGQKMRTLQHQKYLKSFWYVTSCY